MMLGLLSVWVLYFCSFPDCAQQPVAMAPKYILHYFDAKGRAEVIRWIFKVAKVEFEDKRYSEEEWAEFKPKTPFEQLPVLEFEDGEMLCQTGTITFYLASELGNLPSNLFSLFRAGLTGSSKREAAQISSLMHCMQDTCQPLTDIFFGETEEIKKAAGEKFGKVNMPKFLKYLMSNLKDGKEYLVGDKYVVDVPGSSQGEYSSLFYWVNENNYGAKTISCNSGTRLSNWILDLKGTDLAVARLVSDLSPELKTLVSQFAEVQALVDRVLALPEIKDWMEQRPKTEF